MQDYQIATKVLEILFCRDFHQHGKGKNPPKPRSVNYAYFYKKIYEKIVHKKPIELFLGYGYHKNLNACRDPAPDEAERKSLTFLVNLAKKIGKIYEPGVNISIFTTGERAIVANEAKLADTIAYYEGLKKIISEDPEFSKYLKILKLQEIWDSANTDFYGMLHKKAGTIRELIDQDPAKYEKLCLQAISNQTHGSAAKNGAIRDSVARFLASFEAERELNIYSNFSPGLIMLSYRPIPYYKNPTLIVWTTRHGDITQPWQGWYNKTTGQTMTKNRQESANWTFRSF